MLQYINAYNEKLLIKTLNIFAANSKKNKV